MRANSRGLRETMNPKPQPDRTPILESPRPSKPMRRPKATEAEANAMDSEAVRIAAEIRAGWLRLGLLILKMIDSQAYEALGFPNMHAWMTSRFGENLSTVFSALRSVRALEGVPEEQLTRIGERNAHMLTYLPSKQRTSQEWIERAAKLPTKEFKQEVQIELEKKTGMAQERFKTFSIALPEMVYQNMCEAEKKMARSLETRHRGQARKPNHGVGGFQPVDSVDR